MPPPDSSTEPTEWDDSQAGTAVRRYLTPSEVVQRYRQQLTLGTLRNWRSKRIGPSYVRVGKSILYAAASLDEWDRANTVSCRASATRNVRHRDQE